jgi:hypothetical protein
MKIYTREEFLQFLSTLFSSPFFLKCDSKEDPEPMGRIELREVSVPAEINVVAQGEITISGKGFAEADKFKLILTTDAGQTHTVDILSFDETSATFTLPEGFTSGSYRIVLARGSEELTLDTSRINIVVVSDIPDQDGMTVKGMVYSNGVGVPRVLVSDGHEVTTTDQNGVYYLPSQKKTGFVFVSVPANYEAPVVDSIPQFFKRPTGGSSVEQKDFLLTPSANMKHVVVALADWHLANRNDDLWQYGSGILPDVNVLIDDYSSANTKVYGLPLGDASWDAYWYANNYGLVEYKSEMKKVNCPMFNVIGNHDHDPYVANNWESNKKYRKVIGPTYYSFNLGEVHYVVLNNIEYVNTGGGPGVVGQRNYYDVISNQQLEWLKKDLAAIQDKTAPLIIAMHAPLHRSPALDESGEETNALALNNGGALISALQGFSEVYVVTGNVHTNYPTPNASNEVLINVWGFGAKWTIEVSEGGAKLPVSRVLAKDPLHIISYEAKRLNAGAVPTDAFVTDPTAQMFEVAAASATSTIEIKVTDPYGNVHAESMQRPKEFTYTSN